MKALRIFFVHYSYSMSDDVARKGSLADRTKTYSKTQKQSDFPVNTTVDEASAKIYEKYGKRPEGNIYTGHSFAVIVTSANVNVEDISGEY